MGSSLGGGGLPVPKLPTPQIPAGGGGLPSLPGMPGGGGGGGLPGMPQNPFGDTGLLSPSLAYTEQLEKAKQKRLESANEATLAQYGGVPKLGDRQALTPDQYTLNPSQYQGNQGALNALNSKATQEGASPWLKMQLQNQQLQQNQQMNSAARGAAGANAGARAQLAMHGGLSGGAAERLARGGSQDLNQQRQGIQSQGQQNRLNLGVQDESNKNQLLGQAVNANMAQNQQQIGLGQFNVGNVVGQNNAQNAYNMQKYQEQMKGFGAGMSANAIANSGKK